MTRRNRLPELSPGVLRDHATSARVERVWSRLRGGLGDGELDAAPRRFDALSRGALWWAPAAVAIVFGAGVFVGIHWSNDGGSVPRVAPEPQAMLEPIERTIVPSQAATIENEPQPEETRAQRRRTGSDFQASEPAEAAETEAATDVAEPANAARTVSVPAGPPEWQRLANLGDYAASHQELEKEGGFDVALGQADPEQMMSMVDVARATGQRARALHVLRQVLERFPDAPEAPLAAWNLGNILKNAGDLAGAAQAFELYRHLSPLGDFAEDAAARQVDLAIEQGNVDRARQLADRYEKDFPKGRHLAELRERLGRLPEAGESDGAALDPEGDRAPALEAPESNADAKGPPPRQP